MIIIHYLKIQFRQLLIINLLIPGLIPSSYSQSLNYQDLLGEDWKKAEAFEKENRNWIEPLLAKNHISYSLAIAIVFPELVRYSALRDKMEISLLKTLYVNLGEEYADFSIGVFQMKPSFAETIRSKASDALDRRSGISFQNISDFDDIKEFRKSIIKDLEDPVSQINYLIAFIKICRKDFKTNTRDELSRVKFLATAYNFGIEKTIEEIDSMTYKKFFSTKLYTTDNYCYADVSLFWYIQNLTEN